MCFILKVFFVYGGSLTCVLFFKSFCLWWVPHMCFIFKVFLFMVGPSHVFYF